MATPKMKNKKTKSAGFTIIELLIAMAIGSLVLMMLMQMIVMNVTARRKFEYENYLTEQSIQITDYINQKLRDLQPQQVTFAETSPGVYEVTFTREYYIGVDASNYLTNIPNTNPPDLLILNTVTEQVTYNGQLISASNIILTAASVSIDYFSDAFDPNTCTDWGAGNSLCGDGVVSISMTIAVQFPNGNIETEHTFSTDIIV